MRVRKIIANMKRLRNESNEIALGIKNNRVDWIEKWKLLINIKLFIRIEIISRYYWWWF